MKRWIFRWAVILLALVLLSIAVKFMGLENVTICVLSILIGKDIIKEE